MVYNNNPLYTRSNSLTYGLASTADQMDATILRGRRSIYKTNLPLMAEILMGGIVPAEIPANGYILGLQDSLRLWGVNMIDAKGTNIYAGGSPGMINVLPKGVFNFSMYEDEVYETTKFLLNGASTNHSISAPTITLTISGTAVQGVDPCSKIQVDDIIVNWTNSESKHARVTAVDYTNKRVSIVAAAGETAFSAVTDFVTSATCTDTIEIIGTAMDLRNGTRPSTRTYGDFRINSVTTKTYNLQGFENGWEVENTFDPALRPFGNEDRPQLKRNKLDALYDHLNRISRSLVWGKAQNVSASSDRSMFNGLFNTISTNIQTLSDGYLSLSDIDEMIIDRLGGTHSSNILYAFCSIKTLQIIHSLFTSLGAGLPGMFSMYQSGFYNLEVGVAKYMGREVHFIPVADFMDMGARTFPDQTAAGKGYADKIFIVDPAALFTVVGQHQERGQLLFDIEEDVQNPEDTFYFQRNVIRSWLSFVLAHEKTSGIIKNVERADIVG